VFISLGYISCQYNIARRARERLIEPTWVKANNHSSKNNCLAFSYGTVYNYAHNGGFNGLCSEV